MKFNRFIATILCGMVALTQLTGCDDSAGDIDSDGSDKDLSLDISSQYVVLDGKDDSFTETISIKSSGEWTIVNMDESCDWLALSTTEGKGDGDVTIGASAQNPLISSRSAELLVSAGETREMIYVKQSEGSPRLEIVDNADLDLIFTNAGGEQIVKLDCNTNWNAETTYTSGDGDWLTLSASASAGTLSVKSATNSEAVVKSATIKITATDVADPVIINVTLDIDESSATLTATPDALSFAAAGEAKTFEIDSNAKWSIEELSTEDQEWLTISDMTATGDKQITVTAAAHKGAERSVVLKIGYANQTPVEVTLTQAAYVAEISVADVDKSLEILSVGGSKSVEVTSNTTWTAVSSAAWLTITEGAEGENDGSFTLSAGEYTSETEDRVATVTLTGAAVSGDPIVIEVTQLKVTKEASLDVDLTSYNFVVSGGSKDIAVTSANTTWSWAVSGEDTDWLTVTGAAESGNTASGTLSLSAAVNKSTANTATITITYDTDKEKRIIVTQDGIPAAEAIEFTASQISASQIDVVLSSDHTFASDYSFSNSDFVLTYTNDYNADDTKNEPLATPFSGTFTVASAAVSSDGKTLTLTLDASTPSYNTDVIKIKTSALLASALSDGKTLEIVESTVKSSRIVFLDENFEDDKAISERGWMFKEAVTGTTNGGVDLDVEWMANPLTGYQSGAYNPTNGNARNNSKRVAKILPSGDVDGLAASSKHKKAGYLLQYLIISPEFDAVPGEFDYHYVTNTYDTTGVTPIDVKFSAINTRFVYEKQTWNTEDASAIWSKKNYNAYYSGINAWKYYTESSGSIASATTINPTGSGKVRMVIQVIVNANNAFTDAILIDEIYLGSKPEVRTE